MLLRSCFTREGFLCAARARGSATAYHKGDELLTLLPLALGAAVKVLIANSIGCGQLEVPPNGVDDGNLLFVPFMVAFGWITNDPAIDDANQHALRALAASLFLMHAKGGKNLAKDSVFQRFLRGH